MSLRLYSGFQPRPLVSGIITLKAVSSLESWLCISSIDDEIFLIGLMGEARSVMISRADDLKLDFFTRGGSGISNGTVSQNSVDSLVVSSSMVTLFCKRLIVFANLLVRLIGAS